MGLGLVLPLEDMAWIKDAACGDLYPETFFPHGPRGRYPDQHADVAAEAKAVCAECPVSAECLAYALEIGATHGVWGGLDEHERKALKTRGPRS